MKNETYTRYGTDGTKKYWDGNNWLHYPTKEQEIQTINKSLINKSKSFWVGFIITYLILALVGLWSVKGQVGGLLISMACQNILFIIHIRKLNTLK